MDGKWVVVVFGDKRRHSDVVGLFADQASAESFAEEQRLNGDQDCYAFCLVSEAQYMVDNYGCAHCGSDEEECIEGCRYQGGEGDSE